nr:AAA family ATPase [uncultured Blautia sp.]
MRIQYLHIKNFRYIRDLEIRDIESALILVGQNNVGKTAVLSALCALGGQYEIQASDFNEKKQNVEIDVSLAISQEDLKLLHRLRIVSSYRRQEAWLRDFSKKLPSFRDGILTFSYIVNYNGRILWNDGYHKTNPVISEVFPKIYYLDSQRDLEGLQEQLLSFMEDDLLNQMRADTCLFDRSKKCNHCFSCIGLINKQTPEQLNAFEAEKLLEYKLYQLNLDSFSGKVNEYFHKNGGSSGKIRYELTCNTDRIFQVNAWLESKGHPDIEPVSILGKGMRSIYLLSLLEAYLEDDERVPGMILMEDPEIFLHPSLQKKASEILYRLSRKSQVIFTTHSPNLLFQFNSKQIRQMILDESGYSVIRYPANLSVILDDLGFSASDLLNVSFVFIVEGKQDKSRLPLLLSRYYSEIYDQEGNLSRISIISTNSCTNIKTYANLKYINQTYLRDHFLMIRDGDGKDPHALAASLCKYYDERNKVDADRLPRVTPENVLILKYYSFENYFLDPEVMAKIGVLRNAEEFYEIFWKKWLEYLHRLKSGQHLIEILGRDLTGPEDVKSHMEEIRIYMRGHNLYDLFYGRYRKNEEEILKAYIEVAPRNTFKDILDAVDQFVYFENRKL